MTRYGRFLHSIPGMIFRIYCKGSLLTGSALDRRSTSLVSITWQLTVLDQQVGHGGTLEAEVINLIQSSDRRGSTSK